MISMIVVQKKTTTERKRNLKSAGCHKCENLFGPIVLLCCFAQENAGHATKIIRTPIRNVQWPYSVYKEMLQAILALIASKDVVRKKVLLHCKAGVHRAGTESWLQPDRNWSRRAGAFTHGVCVCHACCKILGWSSLAVFILIVQPLLWPKLSYKASIMAVMALRKCGWREALSVVRQGRPSINPDWKQRRLSADSVMCFIQYESKTKKCNNILRQHRCYL